MDHKGNVMTPSSVPKGNVMTPSSVLGVRGLSGSRGYGRRKWDCPALTSSARLVSTDLIMEIV
jgi:hypothetical protein